MAHSGLDVLAEKNQPAANAMTEVLLGFQTGKIQQIQMGADTRIGIPSESSQIAGGLAAYYASKGSRVEQTLALFGRDTPEDREIFVEHYKFIRSLLLPGEAQIDERHMGAMRTLLGRFFVEAAQDEPRLITRRGLIGAFVLFQTQEEPVRHAATIAMPRVFLEQTLLQRREEALEALDEIFEASHQALLEELEGEPEEASLREMGELVGQMSEADIADFYSKARHLAPSLHVTTARMISLLMPTSSELVTQINSIPRNGVTS